jgi:hypothetical protein
MVVGLDPVEGKVVCGTCECVAVDNSLIRFGWTRWRCEDSRTVLCTEISRDGRDRPVVQSRVGLRVNVA